MISRGESLNSVISSSLDPTISNVYALFLVGLFTGAGVNTITLGAAEAIDTLGAFSTIGVPPLIGVLRPSQDFS